MKTFLKLTVFLFVISLISGCSSNSTSSTKKQTPHSENTNISQNYGLDIPYESMKIDANSTPSEVAMLYFSAIQNGELQSIKSCLSKGALSAKSDKDLQDLILNINKTRKNFRIWEGKTSGNFAKVVYLFNNTDDDSITEETLYLIRENNTWKVTYKDISPDIFKKPVSDKAGH